jgi:hypothetical protein
MNKQLIKKDKNIFYIVFDKLDKNKNKNKKDDFFIEEDHITIKTKKNKVILGYIIWKFFKKYMKDKLNNYFKLEALHNNEWIVINLYSYYDIKSSIVSWTKFDKRILSFNDIKYKYKIDNYIRLTNVINFS